MASRFDPETFWDEVRRYGVTVASYTWTMLHDLVEAPLDPRERHHPVRLFIGAGMPRGLWRRVDDRFAPARVVEFYASTEGDAVLVNLTGEKPGCKGRPLPGSAEMRVAAYDLVGGRLEEDGYGFARECAPGEVGMLLTRARADVAMTSESPLRGVFRANDAWLATGDLFRVDDDGDHWLVDYAAGLMWSADGPVPAFPIEDALGDVDAVDLAVAYAVPGGRGDSAIPLAAVTLRAGRALTAGDLSTALGALPAAQRPAIVHVVDEIPVTTWYRPITAALRRAGLPKPAAKRSAWHLDRTRGVYRKLSRVALDELAGRSAAELATSA
jgi:putative long chain acyl-CoA synthase